MSDSDLMHLQRMSLRDWRVAFWIWQRVGMGIYGLHDLGVFFPFDVRVFETLSGDSSATRLALRWSSTNQDLGDEIDQRAAGLLCYLHFCFRAFFLQTRPRLGR